MKEGKNEWEKAKNTKKKEKRKERKKEREKERKKERKREYQGLLHSRRSAF